MTCPALLDRTCASCHVGEVGTDNNRGTLPPYLHDGSAATLADVVTHYNRVRTLGLTAEEQRELVEYLKSL